MFYAVTTDRKLTRIQGTVTGLPQYTAAAGKAPPDGHVGLFFEDAGDVTFTIGGGAAQTITVAADSYLWGTFDSVTAWSGSNDQHVHAVMGAKMSLGQHPHESARVRSTIVAYHSVGALTAATPVDLPDGTIGVFISRGGRYTFTFKGIPPDDPVSLNINGVSGQIVWGEMIRVEASNNRNNPSVFAIVSDREVLRPTSIRG